MAIRPDSKAAAAATAKVADRYIGRDGGTPGGLRHGADGPSHRRVITLDPADIAAVVFYLANCPLRDIRGGRTVEEAIAAFARIIDVPASALYSMAGPMAVPPKKGRR